MMTMASNIVEDSFKNYDKSLLASDLPRAICLETQWTQLRSGSGSLCNRGNPLPFRMPLWMENMSDGLELAAELEKNHRGAKDMHPL